MESTLPLDDRIYTLIDRLDNKIDKIDDKLTEIRSCNQKLHSRVDIGLGPSNTPEPITHKDLVEAISNGNDWADSKKKVKWMIGGFSLAGGGIVASITKLFGHFT